MIETSSFYNNELLTGIAILSILYLIEELEISKALLIQPILSYQGVLDFIKKKNTKIRSIEELITKKSINFTNFNKIFLENMQLSINSILLMKEFKFLDINDNKLIRGEKKFDLENKSLGKRAIDIINGANSISDAINKGEVSNLYLSLRIEL